MLCCLCNKKAGQEQQKSNKNYIRDCNRTPIIGTDNETPQPRKASAKQTPLLDFLE
jgi:hypothetical protein